ncbi:MAG: cobalamin biosynthesis protein, partial [Coriobacteriia bacterium]|nr:cobalamin biosynthesis protein [Coriobacteriia bacterium]
MTDSYHILTFSDSGEKLGSRLIELLHQDNDRCRVSVHRVSNLRETVEPLFAAKQNLVFIGACGIAVRAIAPLLKSKVTDPAVIVIDEQAQHVIPILSGHIGGANRRAHYIARLLGSTPVITTATDVNKVFSFDSFASEVGYRVTNAHVIKDIASAMLRGEEVGLHSDFPIDDVLPDQVVLRDQGALGVSISLDSKMRPFTQTLQLTPQCFYVGIGARKGADRNLLSKFFYQTLAELEIPLDAIACLASIDIKQHEPAIVDLANRLSVNIEIYSATELNTVANHVSNSEFVSGITGTGN